MIHLTERKSKKEKNPEINSNLNKRNSNLETYFTGGVPLLVTPPLYAISVCKLKKKIKKEKKKKISET